MPGRHRRTSERNLPLRYATAGSLSLSMLFAPFHFVEAQPVASAPSAPASQPTKQPGQLPSTLFPEDVNLPLYGHVPNPNPDSLVNGVPRSYRSEASPLTPEQLAVADASLLNDLPDAPTRAAQAGSLVSKEPGKMMVDDRLWNTNTFRFHYNSTDSLGNPSVDTAIFVEPKTPWTGEGPRPVVAIPPGTQGSAEFCDPSIALQEGPSIRIAPFDIVFPYEAIPLAAHLARGAAVVMIDHHRNDAGNQDYVDNVASAQSLLDAVKAAQELGVSPDAPVGIYGYSQGGSAAAAAAERAGIYAPELNIVATAAGAPPSNLLQVLDKINGTALTGAISLAVNSVLDKDPALRETILSKLNTNGQNSLEAVGNYCVAGLTAHNGFETTDHYTEEQVKLATIIKRYAPIQHELQRQKVGKFIPTAPVFLYGNLNDDIIPINQVRELRDDWQELGFDGLTYVEDQTPPILTKTATNHILGMLNNLQQATDFIWNHFPSQPAEQNLAL